MWNVKVYIHKKLLDSFPKTYKKKILKERNYRSMDARVQSNILGRAMLERPTKGKK